MISRASTSALAFALGLTLPGVSFAQPDLSPLQRPSRPMIEAAQQHYLTGTRFFEEGSWDASLIEFIASFQLSGERDLLFNISWTHEKAGRAREALEYAERYLVACRGTDDEERAAKRVAFLKSKYGSLASGAASTGQAAPVPVASPTTPSTVIGATAAPSAVSTSSRAEGRAKVPALAIGLITGGGVLALGGVGCLVGAWATGVQAGSAELAFSQYGGLIDRGHSLDRAGMALTVTGGALVVGGAISWALLARAARHD